MEVGDELGLMFEGPRAKLVDVEEVRYFNIWQWRLRYSLTVATGD